MKSMIELKYTNELLISKSIDIIDEGDWYKTQFKHPHGYLCTEYVNKMDLFNVRTHNDFGIKENRLYLNEKIYKENPDYYQESVKRNLEGELAC